MVRKVQEEGRKREEEITEEQRLAEAADALKNDLGSDEPEEAADSGGEENAREEEAAEGKRDSKKSSSRKEKKEKRDKKDQLIEELNDRLMRTMAEFDNFRKRTEKEKAQMFEVGAKSIIEKILPVLDNFERGLGAISEEEKGSAFAQGIEQIYKQFLSALQEAGVRPIEALGKEFDPNFHNAVMHAEDEKEEENIIVDEFQKGYMYKDTVVRHSMVKVVN